MFVEGAIAKRTAHVWYAKFKNEKLDFKNAPRFARTVELQLLQENSCQTTKEWENKMECSHTAVEKHLHSIEKVGVGTGFRMLTTTKSTVKINESQLC